MKIYRPGDGTPQFDRTKPIESYDPLAPPKPQPPCIVLDAGESARVRGTDAAARAILLEELRRRAFELLREYPKEDCVPVAHRDAHVYHYYKQTDLLNEDPPGICLATGRRTYRSRDHLTADEVRWIFAHHATKQAAMDVVDAYTGLVYNLAPSDGYDSTLLGTSREIMREARKRKDAPTTPPFPDATPLPPDCEMRVATISTIQPLTPSAKLHAEQFKVGMYMIVPATFPTQCTLSVSPLLCWASHTEEDGRARHFIAHPARTVASAWANYHALSAHGAGLPDTLTCIEGQLAERQRTPHRDEASVPYYLHTCAQCQYVGCEIEERKGPSKRTDFYFCTRERVPAVLAVYNHDCRHQAEYHQARRTRYLSEAQWLLARAAELAYTQGLTTRYDQPYGNVHDAVILNARDDREAASLLRERLGEIISGGASGRDAILVATPEHAAIVGNMLEQIFPESGIIVAHAHRHGTEEVLLDFHGPRQCRHAHLVGTVNDETLCVFIEGLGLSTLPAEHVYTRCQVLEEEGSIKPDPRHKPLPPTPEMLARTPGHVVKLNLIITAAQLRTPQLKTDPEFIS